MSERERVEREREREAEDRSVRGMGSFIKGLDGQRGRGVRRGGRLGGDVADEEPAGTNAPGRREAPERRDLLLEPSARTSDRPKATKTGTTPPQHEAVSGSRMPTWPRLPSHHLLHKSHRSFERGGPRVGRGPERISGPLTAEQAFANGFCPAKSHGRRNRQRIARLGPVMVSRQASGLPT